MEKIIRFIIEANKNLCKSDDFYYKAYMNGYIELLEKEFEKEQERKKFLEGYEFLTKDD